MSRAAPRPGRRAGENQTCDTRELRVCRSCRPDPVRPQVVPRMTSRIGVARRSAWGRRRVPIHGILKRIKLGVGHWLSLHASRRAQLASVVPEPMRCVLGGLVGLEQPDGQAKHRTSAEYQSDACVASRAVSVQPSTPDEQDRAAGRNAQAGENQGQPDHVPEGERLELQLNRPLQGASSWLSRGRIHPAAKTIEADRAAGERQRRDAGQALRGMDDAGLEPATSALSRRRSPS